MIYLTTKPARPLSILFLAIVLSNCTSVPSTTVPTSRSTSDPIPAQPGTPGFGPLYHNIDWLSAKWGLTWDQSHKAYVGRKAGVAQISLTEYDEGYVIGSYIYDGLDVAAAEYVAGFQADALRAVLPSGPIQTMIAAFVVDNWDHFWEVSTNDSEYFSASIGGRDVYHEITLDSNDGVEEFIGVGKFQG